MLRTSIHNLQAENMDSDCALRFMEALWQFNKERSEKAVLNSRDENLLESFTFCKEAYELNKGICQIQVLLIIALIDELQNQD